jgi:hypothetical protein
MNHLERTTVPSAVGIAIVMSTLVAASCGGHTAPTPVSAQPSAPALSGISLNTANVIGGSTFQPTITLTSAPSAGGAVVALSTDNQIVSIPATVTVASGTTSATFSGSTTPVAVATAVHITASFGGSAKTETLTVTPAAEAPPPTLGLSAITLSAASIVGGNSMQGTLTLTATAPADGASVTLSSSNPDAATVPATVPVPAGATSASFTVTTKTVGASTTATITGSYGGETRTATLTVLPTGTSPPTLSAVSLSPTTIAGGGTVQGAVALSGNAPSGGATVTLSSGNTAVATVAATVTVAAGTSSALFTVSTAAVMSPASVVITGSYGGATQTATLSVTVPPPVISLSAVSLNPTTIVGGGSVQGTATLSGSAPTGGATVTLSSGNPAVATVPRSVDVAGSATAATFNVSTAVIMASTPVVITGSYGGATRTASLTVTPLPVLKAIPGGPYSQLAGVPLTMSGMSSTSTPYPIAHYRWACGQPIVVNCQQDTPTPTFTYIRVPGTSKADILTFTVTLTIEDTHGNMNTTTTTAAIQQVY